MRYKVPALTRAFDILELLSTQKRLSAQEIATALNLTQSAVFRILYVLEHTQYIEKKKRQYLSISP